MYNIKLNAIQIRMTRWTRLQTNIPGAHFMYWRIWVIIWVIITFYFYISYIFWARVICLTQCIFSVCFYINLQVRPPLKVCTVWSFWSMSKYPYLHWFYFWTLVDPPPLVPFPPLVVFYLDSTDFIFDPSPREYLLDTSPMSTKSDPLRCLCATWLFCFLLMVVWCQVIMICLHDSTLLLIITIIIIPASWWLDFRFI